MNDQAPPQRKGFKRLLPKILAGAMALSVYQCYDAGQEKAHYGPMIEEVNTAKLSQYKVELRGGWGMTLHNAYTSVTDWYKEHKYGTKPADADSKKGKSKLEKRVDDDDDNSRKSLVDRQREFSEDPDNDYWSIDSNQTE